MLLALLKKIFCCGSSESSDENPSATLKTPLIGNGSKEKGTPDINDGRDKQSSSPSSSYTAYQGLLQPLETNNSYSEPQAIVPQATQSHTQSPYRDVVLDSTSHGSRSLSRNGSSPGSEFDAGLNIQSQGTHSYPGSTSSTPGSEFNVGLGTPNKSHRSSTSSASSTPDSLFNAGLGSPSLGPYPRSTPSTPGSEFNVGILNFDSDGSDVEQDLSKSLH